MLQMWTSDGQACWEPSLVARCAFQERCCPAMPQTCLWGSLKPLHLKVRHLKCLVTDPTEPPPPIVRHPSHDCAQCPFFAGAWQPGETRPKNLREKFAEGFAEKIGGNSPKNSPDPNKKFNPNPLCRSSGSMFKWAFRKFRTNFCPLPCHMSQEPNRKPNLFRWALLFQKCWEGSVRRGGGLSKFVANCAPYLCRIACLSFRTSEEGCPKLSKIRKSSLGNLLQMPFSNAPFSEFLTIWVDLWNVLWA